MQGLDPITRLVIESVFEEVLDRLEEELDECVSAGEEAGVAYVQAKIDLYTNVLLELSGDK